MFRYPMTLWVAAALACTTLSASAATCRKPEYPPESLKLGEEGISLIGFLIRPDGTVARSVVLNSSGSADLDRETVAALSKCPFKPVTKDGQPVEAWEQVMYLWKLDDDPGMARAKHAAAAAASRGDVGARYQLSMLVGPNPDPGRALVLLRSAAELGLAHAQFEMGRSHEKGLNGATVDIEEAMRWYRKAADQGDVFAIQRVEQGLLP